MRIGSKHINNLWIIGLIVGLIILLLSADNYVCSATPNYNDYDESLDYDTCEENQQCTQGGLCMLKLKINENLTLTNETEKQGVCYYKPEMFGGAWVCKDKYFNILVFAVVFALGWLFTYKFKYDTTQFIGDGVHGSMIADDKPRVIGLWTYARLGGMKTLGVSGRDKIVVYPTGTGQYCGFSKNYICYCRFEPYDFEDLPHEIKNDLINRKLDKLDEYYRAFDTTEREIADYELIRKSIDQRDQDGIIHKKDALLKDKGETIESAVGIVDRVMKRVRPQKRGLFRRKSKEEEEQNREE